MKPLLAASFYKEWMAHPDWWFNQSDEVDHYLTSQYECLLDISINIPPSITKIIICDQLVRHVFRHQQANHIIEYFLQIALHTLSQMDESMILTPDEWCFSQLPIRHSRDPKAILQVISKAWQRLDQSPQNQHAIFTRFLKASYDRFPVADQSVLLFKTFPTNTLFTEEEKDILLNNPLTSQEPPLLTSHPLIKPAIDIIQNYQAQQKNQKTLVILSISGGVDSMVCSYLTQFFLSETTKVIAVHVNYKNRPTCDLEESIVVKWCHRRGLPLFVRRLDEIRRKPCMKYGMRETYESYTRNVRYSCYKTIQSMNQDCHQSIVLLGHNKDDCLENIFQNIAQQCKYDNLTGMTTLSSQDNITFFRPLLQVPKDDINAFAKLFHIPHLYPTTPPWMHRGQIRSVIVPTLNKWNPQFVPAIHDLSEQLTSMYHMTQQFIDTFIKDRFDYLSQTTFTFSVNHMTDAISDLFWKMLFEKHKIYLSKRSLNDFSNRWQKIKQSKYKYFLEGNKMTIPLQKKVTMTLSKSKNADRTLDVSVTIDV